LYKRGAIFLEKKIKKEDPAKARVIEALLDSVERKLLISKFLKWCKANFLGFNPLVTPNSHYKIQPFSKLGSPHFFYGIIVLITKPKIARILIDNCFYLFLNSRIEKFSRSWEQHHLILI
jgi:hypothetical protein